MEEIKKCTKCKMEFPATKAFFYRDAKAGDGLRSWCRDCTKKAVKNSSSSKYRRKTESREKIKRPVKEPLATASPEAIIAALRKGVAREIIQIIEERF